MKMFNKKMILIASFFLLLMLIGCEKAPGSLTNQEKKSERNFSSQQYVSLDEAKKQVKQLEGNNIKGIVLPKNIQMPEISTVSEVKLKPWYSSDGRNIIKTLKNIWTDYKKVDWNKIKEKNFPRKDNKSYYAKSKDDSKTGEHFSYCSDGSFGGDSLHDTELSCSTCVKKYDFEWGDTVSDNEEYQLEGGKAKVVESVRYVENKFNQNLSKLEKNKFQYKIQHLYVMKHIDEDYYDYNMVLGRIYKGVSLDTSSVFNLPAGKYYDKTHSGVHIEVIMRQKNNVDSFTVGTELYEIEKETEQKKIISPVWAVNKVSTEIAHEGGMGFEDCGLFYIYVQKNKGVEKKEQEIAGPVNRSTYLRPVWMFMASRGLNAYDTTYCDTHGASVLVDALDGSLYYYECTGAY